MLASLAWLTIKRQSSWLWYMNGLYVYVCLGRPIHTYIHIYDTRDVITLVNPFPTQSFFLLLVHTLISLSVVEEGTESSVILSQSRCQFTLLGATPKEEMMMDERWNDEWHTKQNSLNWQDYYGFFCSSSSLCKITFRKESPTGSIHNDIQPYNLPASLFS